MIKSILQTIFATVAVAGVHLPVSALEDSDWYRQAAISPDGKTIAFSHKGNIFVVPASGGEARPLTVHEAWEGHPVWSRDSKTIAFASDRHGNLDIFTIPSGGGVAKRITYFSGDDLPSDFSRDGKSILFSSNRQLPIGVAMGNRRAAELYAAPISGGTPKIVIPTPASEARYSPDGKSIYYRGEKSFEDEFRKHDRSAFTRDLWRYDLKSGKHSQLTIAAGGDHTPVPAGRDLYFLSDRDGTFNLYKQRGDKTEKLTDFDTHPVRSLSRAKNGILAFTMHGGLYTLKPGAKPTRVSVKVAADNPSDITRVDVSGQASAFAIAPSGKEVAFIARGDVFVSSMEFATTVRVTNTPEEEQGLAFTKDGTLIYGSERDGQWQLFEATKEDGALYFFTATNITEAKIETGFKHAEFPLPSPDGKKIAFMADHLSLHVLERETGKTYKLSDPLETYGPSAGGTAYSWSPDSKWVAYDPQPNLRLFWNNIALQPWDGSQKPRDISLSGYTDASPRWHKSGEVITWFTSRYGRRDHGSHGTEFDVMAGFLTEDAMVKFNRSKEEAELAEEAEKKAKDAAEKAAKDDADKKADADKEADKSEDQADKTDITWDRMEKRQQRLTIHSSNLADAVLSDDMTKLYYLTRFEGGYDLWMQDFREQETKKIVGLGTGYGGMELTPDGKKLILLSRGRLTAIDLSSKSPKPIAVRANIDIDRAAERAFLFDHVWNQANDWFYKGDDKHGRDWHMLYAAYKPKIAGIAHNRDMAELVSELLGELNASHTGGRYRGFTPNADRSVTYGAVFDWADMKDGLSITHIWPEGPISMAASDVKVGDKLIAVDGQNVAGANIYALGNNTAGSRVRLTIQSGKEKRDIVVKPMGFGAESGWAYEHWVDSRAAEVEKLSGGRLGYVHVPFMGDSVYRSIYRDIFGKYFTKEALIVDTRWNGGGDLMEDLIRLLVSAGEVQYTRNAPLGTPAQGEPLVRWTKPTIVLANEGNYSDGHCFPTAYKNVKGGKLVGAPVPGTCTYVWWELTHTGDFVFGVPTLGIFDPAGDWLENKQTNPDIEVYNSPEVMAAGGDTQLEVAVRAMLKDLDAK